MRSEEEETGIQTERQTDRQIFMSALTNGIPSF